MGLDIFTNNSRMRVGSYSGVQYTRIKAIRFFTQKLEEIEPELKLESVELDDDNTESMRLLHKLLAGSIEYAEESGCPDYDYFPVTSYLYDYTGEKEDDYSTINRALCGLNAWVDHSDCDGIHSPGEAKDVAFCLEWLTSQVPTADESEDYIDRDYWVDLTEFYKLASETDQIIRFG